MLLSIIFSKEKSKMNKKKLFVALTATLVVLSCLLVFGGCADKNTPVETEPRVRGDVVDSEMVLNKDLGFIATRITSDDEFIADATVREQKDGVSIKVYSDGTAKLTAYDWWENTATIEVIVENSQIKDINVTPIAEKSANVLFFGATGKGLKDESVQVQAAIDSLPEGGTVYFPAGVYHLAAIELRDNITLKLQGRVDDVKAGYTDELKSRIEAGEFAVIKHTYAFLKRETNDKKVGNQLMLNHVANGSGANGASNISIIGGMIDLGGRLASGKAQVDVDQEGFGPHKMTSTAGIYLSCGENFLIENVIFKDCYNSHVFQITGSKNTTIKDCMFAGYTCYAQTKGSVNSILLTRETIQLENAGDGAIPPSTFEPGEFYSCETAKITGCYFGDSDTAGYQMIPIGQHGSNGLSNINGVEISDNVFDNPYYTAIRFPNYSDVVIKNNKFVSDQKAFPLRYLIELYSVEADRTFTGTTVSGNTATVTNALSYSHDGMHGVDIINNEFSVTGTSNKKILQIVGTTVQYGAKSVSGKIMLDPDTFKGYSYTGFVKSTNIISDVNISGNKMIISSSNADKNHMIMLSNIVGFNISDNTFECANGIAFSSSYNGISGIRVSNEKNGDEARKAVIETKFTTKYIILPDGNGGTIKINANSATLRKLTLYSVEGMKLTFTTDKEGNLTVNTVCDEGKTFAGWTTENGTAYKPGATATISSDIVLKATIK